MESLPFVYGATAITLLLLPYLHWNPAPYGKFTPGVGVFSSFKINGKLAWCLQECPAFFVAFYILIVKWSTLSSVSVVGLALFSLHYFLRSFVFAFLLQGDRKTPIDTCFSAFIFCCFNGWLQSKSIQENDTFGRNPKLMGIGLVLFFAGMYINWAADGHLRELARTRIGNQYLTPHAGMFKYVSAANYFGEIVEWFGFVLFVQTPGAAWFSLFSTCFLGQRGYQTHRYYLSKIDDYPKDRSSVFPFSGF